MTDNLTVSDFEIDQLKESINIGASHASNALSVLIKKKVLLSVPEVHISNFLNSINFIGNGESNMTSIKVKVQSDKNGVMFYLFPRETDAKLLNIINPGRPDGATLSEEDKSVLCEIGNILSGSFLTAISKFLGVDFLHSASEVTSDKFSKVVNSAVTQVISDSDKLMILKVSLEITDENIKTDLFFLMDPEFTRSILDQSRKIMEK